MLVSVLRINQGRDRLTDAIAILAGGPALASEVLTGIYVIGHFNLDHNLRNLGFKTENYPKIPLIGRSGNYIKYECVPPYGVCDSPHQFLEKFEASLADPNRKFVVGMCCIRRDEQPDEDGWRWHKWGEYVGEKTPTTEYIYDEPLITEVYTFHVYELL